TGLVLALLIVTLMPRAARVAGLALRDAARRIALGIRSIAARPLAALAVLATMGTIVAYRAHPVLVIPMGSGRETAFEHGLGSFDLLEGTRFRHLTAPAVLDLRDAGGGPWRIAVTASADGEPAVVPILDAGAGVVESALGPRWSVVEATAQAPTG